MHVEESPEWTALHIQDNGCGISTENQDKIYDPFYTSKEVGSGMGLGLSICYRILQQHGAKVEMTSEVGKGTHFILNFPSVSDDMSPQEQKQKIDLTMHEDILV